MIDEDGLNVWFEHRLVGYLWRNDIDYIGFRYEQAWLAGDGFPISRTLPLQVEEFAASDRLAHRFFANLLPEGGAREHVVRDLRIPDTDFDLLKHIGGECAGALSILPAEKEPSSQYRYHPLGAAEMGRLVVRRGQFHASQNSDERPRLSLAGAQDKCAVLFRDGEYFNPVDDAPSTHILKFESPDYRNLPAYEAFTSFLAARIGMPVVQIELREIGGKKFAQVARYDRAASTDSSIVRVHQEDFCQALGYAHTRKYQHDGGPGFAECLELLRDTSDDPAVDTDSLIRWQVFNVLAGNSDGHAKNLSLLYHPSGEIRLAPFYDLVCTRAVERIDSNLAFDVGGQRNPANITHDDWSRFAAQCDIGARYLHKVVSDTAAQLLSELSSAVADFSGQYGKTAALQRVVKVVKRQCAGVG